MILVKYEDLNILNEKLKNIMAVKKALNHIRVLIIANPHIPNYPYYLCKVVYTLYDKFFFF